MNLRTAKQVAKLSYGLHKIMLKDNQIIHAYISNDQILDAQMQFNNLEAILEIEKYSQVPIIVQGPDPEIDEPGEPYPYEVGITIESIYFFANCNKEGLLLYGLPVPAENGKEHYVSK